MRPLIFFFVFFLCVSFSSAFDCSYFSDQSECLALSDYNDSLVSNLVYSSYSFPNHNFIKDYNENIVVSYAPFDTSVYASGNLENVWFSFLYASPSVSYQDNLLVDGLFWLRSEYDFDYVIPETYRNDKKRDGRTCKIIYSLYDQSSDLKIYANDNYISSDKNNYFLISKPTTFKGLFTSEVVIKERHYEWDRYCCARSDGSCIRHCYDCDYEKTVYDTDTLTAQDTITLSSYDKPLNPDFTVNHVYANNFIGEINNTNNNLKVTFDNSYYQETFFEYGAVFSKEPYYFLTLEAKNYTSKDYRNIFINNKTLTANNNETCTLEYNNFFDTETKECSYDIKPLELEPFEKEKFSNNWKFLLYLAVFIFILWLVYQGIKHTWGKAFLPIIILMAIIPGVSAEECGLTNLASCIPQKIYSFFIDLLNAPLQPLLGFIQNLLTTPPSIEIFKGVWAIMVYCISFFYGLLFMYAGFQFLFSGHNVLKRAIAKQWLKNTVIMIVLIQGSFYLYELALELGAILSSSVLSLADPQFFLLTADNLMNIGLEFLFVSLYAITLLITLLLLLIRYLIISFGVIFLPIGIFCYFVPPLKSYGKLILNMLGTFIFITFIYSIIILGCSMLIELPIFANVKIMVMIACFSIINLSFIILTIKAMIKAVFSSGQGENIAEAVKYIGMMV